MFTSFQPLNDDITAKTIYKINASKRPLLGYYKNNCIGFFISATYTSLAILKLNSFKFKHADLVTTYNDLKALFDKEFTYDRETPAEMMIRKDIKAFINDGILTPHPTVPDTYDITPEGYRKLNCFASFLKTYMESYLVDRNTDRRQGMDHGGKDSLQSATFRQEWIWCMGTSGSKICFPQFRKQFLSPFRLTERPRCLT